METNHRLTLETRTPDIFTAIAVLALGGGASDGRLDSVEVAKLISIFQAHYNVSPALGSSVVARALKVIVTSSDDAAIAEATTVLRENLTENQRQQVIECLMTVICADGNIHLNELAFIATISEQIGLAEEARDFLV